MKIIRKLVTLFSFLLPFSVEAQYKLYFYNSVDIDNYKLIIQIFENESKTNSYALILNPGENWLITASQFNIINFWNLIKIERSDVVCSEIQLFNSKISQGYFLKLSMNYNYIGEICATKYLPTDKNINAYLEFTKDKQGKFILKLSNAGWFIKNVADPNYIEVSM